jgi:hypothetical protein
MKKTTVVFHPNLRVTNNKERPKIGTRCKVADDYQTFHILVESITGELVMGRIDNIMKDTDYKYGDKVLFSIDCIM